MLDDHQVVRFLVPGQVADGFRLRMQGVQSDHLPDEVQVRDVGRELGDLVGSCRVMVHAVSATAVPAVCVIWPWRRGIKDRL
jgi:hypothetical protein